jgi:hypothetical protein
MAPTSGVLTSTNFGKASTFVMPPKKTAVTGAALQILDTNQEMVSLREARSQKRKTTSPTFRRRSWTRRSGTWKSFINRYKGKRRRWPGWPTFRRRSTKPLKKYAILPRMTMTESLSTGSFARRAHSTKKNGMMTFIMAILLLMMLLPWQHNCRLPRGRRDTSHLIFLCMMGTQTQSNS